MKCYDHSKANQKKVDLYANCLYEIKNRTSVIQEHLSGQYSEKYVITEVEFLCIQFRKILEIIALGSLVANNEIYRQNHKKFASDWHADRILKDIERINPNYYPVPVTQVKKTVEGKSTIELLPRKGGFLTRNEFSKLYEKCGCLLHAENPFGNSKNFEGAKSEFPDWLGKIILLLNCHNLMLSDGDMLSAVMENDVNKRPSVAIFSKAQENYNS